MMLARGFGISLIEFLDDDVFRSEDLEIDQQNPLGTCA